VEVRSYLRDAAYPAAGAVARVGRLESVGGAPTVSVEALDGFRKYLRHGMLGTSAPKAAVVFLEPGARLPAGSSLVLLASGDGRTLEVGVCPREALEGAVVAAHSASASSGVDLARSAARAAMDDLETTVYRGEDGAVPSRVASKRRFLFSGLPAATRERLALDEVALYSVTEWGLAERTTEVVADALAALGSERGADGVLRPSVVCDATACVGGNTISFARRLERVVAIEVSPTRAQLLRENVRAADVAHRVDVLTGDCAALLPTLRFTALFFDPPWGGPDYKKKEKLDLWLGDRALADVVRDAVRDAPRSGLRLLVLKLPFNFHYDAFETHLAGLLARSARIELQPGAMHLALYRVLARPPPTTDAEDPESRAKRPRVEG
jgi:RNA cap guanine-N2 methyltransferase